MTEEQDALRAGLLEAEVDSADEVPRTKGGRRWRAALTIVASVFLSYHLLVLLTWNTPSKGLSKKFHTTMLDKTKGRPYFRGTSNTQSWSMFAPNPNRTNVFIRVLVTDLNDDTYDLKHDIYKVDRYPYWFYDRMGKINRRIDGKKSYQRVYGAWVCREWEREHGELPKHVQFVKRWTKIPTPQEARRMGWGYDPWELPAKQKEQEKIDCAKTVHAQLPPRLRERYGMEPAPEDHFRDVRIATWFSKAEQERKREERAREREERRKNRDESTGLVAPADPYAVGGAGNDEDAGGSM
jgi:hypothetical protein